MRRRSGVFRSGAAIALFAGIDGGQSSTTATLGDETRILARGSGPPADLVGEARDSKRQVEALAAALGSALDAAGLPRSTRLRALVAGISGFDGGHSTVPNLDALAERSDVVHDTAIAHAGALDGAPGIVVIAGTGSVALGNASPGGAFVRCGGWGYFFGDEGSALWIAREALHLAMVLHDRAERSALAERAFLFYGTNSLRAIQHAFAHGEISRPALAAFASEVLDLAVAGDADAASVRYAAAGELALLADTVHRRLGAGVAAQRILEPAAAPLRNEASSAPLLLSRVGGLFNDAGFALAFRDALERAMPGSRLVEPVHDPATGALLLARKLGAG